MVSRLRASHSGIIFNADWIIVQSCSKLVLYDFHACSGEIERGRGRRDEKKKRERERKKPSPALMVVECIDLLLIWLFEPREKWRATNEKNRKNIQEWRTRPLQKSVLILEAKDGKWLSSTEKGKKDEKRRREKRKKKKRGEGRGKKEKVSHSRG